MRKNLLTTTILTGLMAFVGAGAAMADATAYVVHGVPGVPVDVYVNYNTGDDPALPGLLFETIEGPIPLPAGSYAIDIYVAGSDPEVDSPAISGDVILVDGQTVALVAHLTADGGLTLSQFGLDLRRTRFNETRVGIRHTAAAPSVDAIIRSPNRDRSTISVTNPGGASIDVRAGRTEIRLALPGTTDAIFGPLSDRLRSGKVYFFYAVGDYFGGTFTIIPQVLDVERGNGIRDFFSRYRDRDDDDDDDDDDN